MRRTFLAFLLVFLVAACGGDEKKPTDTAGKKTPGGGDSGEIATLKARPGGETKTPDKPPPPIDPTVALEKLADIAFGSEDPDVQIEALDKIFSATGNREKRAKIIARALDSEDEDIRSYAADVLGKMEVPSIAHNLRSLLARETDTLVRKQALVSLYALAGRDAVTDLITVLANEDEHYSIRSAACQLLGRTKSDRAILPLMKVLEEEFNESVRREAVAALAALSAKRAQKLIIEALSDSNSLVRTEAAKALGKMKTKKAVGPLIDALDLDEEDEIQVLEAISRALGAIIGLDKEDLQDYLLTGNHSEAQQKAAVANWQEWWEENQGDYE